MELKFLGSAAAEGFPALWCECETCRQASLKGGKDIRRRTSYLIDSDTIVDFGPDAFFQTISFGIDLLKVERLIFTHPHGDHLSPMELLWRRDGWFSHVTKKIKVFGPRSVLDSVARYVQENSGISSLDDINVIPCALEHGVAAIDGGLEILPLDADHAPGKSPYIYMLSRSGRRLLVANDTGWLPEASWSLLKDAKLDLAIIDSTLGIRSADSARGHMGVNAVVKFNEELKRIGALKEGAETYANHFSHNGGNLHEDLLRFFAPHGIKVAYDGLSLSV